MNGNIGRDGGLMHSQGRLACSVLLPPEQHATAATSTISAGNHPRPDHRLTFTRPISASASTSGPIAAANVAPWWMPNTPTATAMEKERRHFTGNPKGKDAETFARLVRCHRQIEDQLHGSLDVGFSEDASRIRSGYAAENFSQLRRIVANRLKRKTTEELGIKGKRLRSAWDEQYLLTVLTDG